MTFPKHVVVTGGSSGIGKATAALYRRRGANITIIARDRARLSATHAELEASGAEAGGEVLTLAADVTDVAAIEGAIARATQRFGAPDVLVNSAGIAGPGYFEQLPLDSFREQMEVNFFGTLHATRAVLPAMRAAGGGRIVMIASGAALIGVFGYTAYGPTKFALRGLAEALRSELRQSGIGVTIVYPPDTDTPQLHYENLVKPDETKLVAGAARVWQPEEVAGRIVRGVENGHFSVTCGWEMTLLKWTHSFLRPALDWHFDRKIAANAAKKSPPAS